MRVVAGLAKLVIATVLAGVLVAGLMLPYAIGIGLASNRLTTTIDDTPTPDFSQPIPQRTTFTDAKGTPIAYFYQQNRVPVTLDKISEYLQYAVIATEDRRFLTHSGVDWRGTVRAVLKDSSGTTQQGGSTLTQQYVKNYRYLVLARTDAEKQAAIAASSLRKLQEAKIALRLEAPVGPMTKDDVLSGYLNLVAFGPNVYGAEASSQYFFGEHANQLTLPQAALLAGMVNNPNQNNPFSPEKKFRDNALQRKDVVLQLMADNGYITQATANLAKKQDLGLDRSSPAPDGCLPANGSATNGFFCTYVLDYLQNYQGLSLDDIERNGYTVKTTMDPTAMKDAKNAVNTNADASVKANASIANVLAIVKPGAGQRRVLALVANRTYGQGTGETVQRLPTTFAPLGAGSIFKVFTAAEALQEGLGTQSQLAVPAQYTSPLVPTHAFNNSGSFPTKMTMQQALATSPNTPFVALEDQMGLKKVTDMAVALGLKGYNLDAGAVDRTFTNVGQTYAQVVQSQKIASFTLGVSPVSPLELANVGATLASDGQWCQPTPIDTLTDSNGNVVQLKAQPCVQAVNPDLAHALTQAMQDDMRRQGQTAGHYTGTAAAAAQAAGWTRTAASKTGTTQDYKSSAFLGYTPYYSGAVLTWDYSNHPQSICVDAKTNLLTGSCSTPQAQSQTNDKSTKGMGGGSVPAATWFAAMTPLHAGLPESEFPPTTSQYVEGAPNSQVPNVVGMDITTAIQQLKTAGFQFNSTIDTTSGAGANVVTGEDPQYTALPGSTIQLKVSAGG